MCPQQCPLEILYPNTSDYWAHDTFHPLLALAHTFGSLLEHFVFILLLSNLFIFQMQNNHHLLQKTKLHQMKCPPNSSHSTLSMSDCTVLFLVFHICIFMVPASCVACHRSAVNTCWLTKKKWTKCQINEWLLVIVKTPNYFLKARVFGISDIVSQIFAMSINFKL